MQPSRRQYERIAARENDLPDFAMCGDISKCRLQSLGAQDLVFSRANHFAAETEAAIDGANMRQFQQHPIAVTMDDSSDGLWRTSPIGSAFS